MKVRRELYQNPSQGCDISAEPCKMSRIYPAEEEGALQAEHIFVCHLAC